MLSLNDLSVTLDDGTAVVGETEVVIEPGERPWSPANPAPERARWYAR
jgi:hypothetical protein